MKTIPSTPRGSPALLLVVAALGTLTGCQSLIEPPRTTVELAREQINATHEISGAINSLEKGVTNDPEASARRIAAIEARIAKSEARVDAVAEEANTRNEKIKEKVIAVTGDVAQVASAFSGLSIAPGLVKSVTDVLHNRVDTVDDRFKRSLKAEVTGLQDDIARKIGDQVKLNESQMAQYRAEVLAAAKAQGLSKEDVAKLEGMSDSELLGLLGGGGGLAGLSLAALLRTFGKSRSQDDINQLWDNVADLKVKLAAKE